jgi:ABC-type bacteriocin/lantibiotic exporter with double-glycine peptidase domain
LEGLIASFPEKGDKIIAENGKNISGGQRQRISIARALYKAADLIILDEPFNELDETSEIALLTHFQQLAQNGKMVILITHNKQSLSFCNKIVSLDGSTI